MAFEEDLSVYFDDFGVSFAPDLAAPFQVIFDKAYLSALSQLESSGPMALARDADISTAQIAQGSQGTIAGAAYEVVGLQPDGTGLTLLQLREAN